MYKAVLFDLDGTLTDTLQDIAAAMNRALRLHGLMEFAVEDYRYLVGDGAKKLAERAVRGRLELKGAVLRTRRSGDRIRPLGASGSQKLSDRLIDRKIDRPLRDWIPLIAIDSRVLWAFGAGIAEEARITESTRTRVRITLFPITDE